MRIAVLFVGLLASASIDTVAMAKDKEDNAPAEITPTGVQELDDVFMKAKDIQANLTTSKSTLQKANDDVNSSLGLAKGTPFKDALADLNKKADGKVKVALTGKTPTLKAQDGCPDNVKSSVDATNKAIGEISTVVDNTAGLSTQAQALADQSAKFVGDIPSVAKNSGLGITEIPKFTKTVKSDASIVAQTPAQAKAVAEEAKSMLDAVISTFPKE